jgi:hypothetical protein
MYQTTYTPKAIEAHQISPEIHSDCSLSCPGFKLLPPPEHRPLRVLFVLDHLTHASSYEEAQDISSHFHYRENPPSHDPAVIAWQDHPKLRGKFVFRKQNSYLCHDWVRALLPLIAATKA